MSSAAQLIQLIETSGGRFTIEAGRLGVVPARVVLPVLEELRRNKGEILELLSRRPAMPAGLRLLRWEPKEGYVQLTPCEEITEVDKFIRTTLRQVAARLHGKSWLAGNRTLSTLIDRLA